VQSRSNNPLLIKWFVLGIKAGKTLPELRSTNHDAVKFCVEAVILALTPPSRNVLISLYVLKKPTLLEELLTICEVSIDELSLSLQELSKSALIKTKYLGDALRAEYILAEMPEIYLNQSSHYMEQEIIAANIKAQKLIEDEEKRQLDIRKSKFSPFSISIRDDGDKAVAALLRTALRKQRIAPQSALGLIEEAKHALPGYWENYKTEAYVRSFLNQTSEVEKLLNIALELAPDNISKSVCSYRLSQFYIDNNDLEKSLIFANLSVEYEKDSYNLQLLGWVLIRNMSFESGVATLQSGLDSADASSILIAKTKLISGYRRWGDNILERERNPTRAMAQFAKARDLIFGEVMAGTYEEKLLEEYVKLIFSITNVFRSIYTNSGTISHEEDLTLSEYLTFADRTAILNRYKDQVQNSLRILSGVGQKTSEIIGNLTFNFPSKNLVGSTKSIDVFEGQILSTNNGRYGFIANPNFPHNIFFAGSVLIAGTKMEQLLPGVLVHFEIDYGKLVEADRVKASAVWVK
jgi:tetratricopeptide (TPR) repeat protein